jgi:hypothetical protein
MQLKGKVFELSENNKALYQENNRLKNECLNPENKDNNIYYLIERLENNVR